MRRTRRPPTTTSPRTPSTAPPPTSSPGTTSNLIPELYDEFGGFTLGIVFAHEFGHAIQTRAGHAAAPRSCWSSRPTASPARGPATSRRATPSYFDARRSTTSTRPSPASSRCATASAPPPTIPPPTAPASTASAPSSTATSRASSACAEYPDDAATGDLVVVEVPFTDQDDFDRGGNLPLDRAGVRSLARGPRELLDDPVRGARARTWTPVTDVVPIDPAADEVDCGDDTYSRRRARERVLLLRRRQHHLHRRGRT